MMYQNSFQLVLYTRPHWRSLPSHPLIREDGAPPHFFPIRFDRRPPFNTPRVLDDSECIQCMYVNVTFLSLVTQCMHWLISVRMSPCQTRAIVVDDTDRQNSSVNCLTQTGKLCSVHTLPNYFGVLFLYFHLTPVA